MFKAIPVPSAKDLVRFMRKTKMAESGCLEWTAASGRSRGGDRYGTFFVGGSNHGAHRLALAWATSVRQTDLTVDHLCGNSMCVNPQHLEWATQRENSHRSNNASGRHARATECPSGHPYNELNTYVRPDGKGRGCNTCRRAQTAAANALRKVA